MKRILLLIVCAALVLNGFAQTDTTKTKTNVITIVEDSTKTEVVVGDAENVEVVTDDWGDTTHIRLGRRTFKVIEGDRGRYIKVEKETQPKKRYRRLNPHWAGIEFGLSTFYDKDYSFYIDQPEYDDIFELKVIQSHTWNFNILEYAFANRQNNFALVTGLGFSLNDYTFNNAVTLEKEFGTGDILPVFLDHETLRKSKLHVDYLTVPLFIEIRTPLKAGASNLNLIGGVIGGLYLNSYTRIRYHNGDNARIRSNFHINQFKYDITGRIAFGDLTFFANYSMTSLFKTDFGPKLHPLTIGISFPNI